MYVNVTGGKHAVLAASPEVVSRAGGPMEFVIIAQYRAQGGADGTVEAALRRMVAPTRAEPGNLDYQVFRDPRDPSLFVLFERYADSDAFEAHRAAPHF